MALVVPNVTVSLELFVITFSLILFSFFISIPAFLILYFIDKKLYDFPNWKRKGILFIVGLGALAILDWAIFNSEFDKADLFVNGLVIGKIFLLGLTITILIIRPNKLTPANK